MRRRPPDRETHVLRRGRRPRPREGECSGVTTLHRRRVGRHHRHHRRRRVLDSHGARIRRPDHIRWAAAVDDRQCHGLFLVVLGIRHCRHRHRRRGLPRRNGHVAIVGQGVIGPLGRGPADNEAHVLRRGDGAGAHEGPPARVRAFAGNVIIHHHYHLWRRRFGDRHGVDVRRADHIGRTAAVDDRQRHGLTGVTRDIHDGRHRHGGRRLTRGNRDIAVDGEGVIGPLGRRPADRETHVLRVGSGPGPREGPRAGIATLGRRRIGGHHRHHRRGCVGDRHGVDVRRADHIGRTAAVDDRQRHGLTGVTRDIHDGRHRHGRRRLTRGNRDIAVDGEGVIGPLGRRPADRETHVLRVGSGPGPREGPRAGVAALGGRGIGRHHGHYRRRRVGDRHGVHTRRADHVRGTAAVDDRQCHRLTGVAWDIHDRRHRHGGRRLARGNRDIAVDGEGVIGPLGRRPADRETHVLRVGSGPGPREGPRAGIATLGRRRIGGHHRHHRRGCVGDRHGVDVRRADHIGRTAAVEDRQRHGLTGVTRDIHDGRHRHGRRRLTRGNRDIAVDGEGVIGPLGRGPADRETHVLRVGGGAGAREGPRAGVAALGRRGIGRPAGPVIPIIGMLLPRGNIAF